MKQSLLGIFFLILLEYACFPVSSEIVLPLAGGICARSGIHFISALFYSVLSGLIGTTIMFFAGRLGGTKFLDRFSVRFPKSQSHIQASYRFFGNHGKAAVCLARVIPICRTYIALIAGAGKMSLSPYLLYSLIGISIWNAMLLSIGYFGFSYRSIFITIYEKYKLLILFFGGTILILTLLFRFTRTQDDQDQ